MQPYQTMTPAMVRASRRNAAIARRYITSESTRPGGLAAARSPKMKRWHKNKWKDPEYRRKTLKGQRSFHCRKVRQKTGRKLMKKYWNDPKKVKAHLKRVREMNFTPSKPQRSLFRRLCRAGVRGIKLEHRCGRKLLDIAHIPTKTNIEVDGPTFHKDRNRDRRRDRYIRSRGWKIVRVLLIKNEVSEKSFRRVLKCLKYS